MIKLARLGYKAQEGETVVDITVKNSPDHVLSPTWDMVLGFQRKAISWDEYEEAYVDLMRKRWKDGRKGEFVELARKSRTQTLVFVCFCADENLCHRSLAKEMVERTMSWMVNNS
jgi:uncharacterized protein YeaO (DUF488 family)